MLKFLICKLKNILITKFNMNKNFIFYSLFYNYIVLNITLQVFNICMSK